MSAAHRQCALYVSEVGLRNFRVPSDSGNNLLFDRPNLAEVLHMPLSVGDKSWPSPPTNSCGRT
jgi:hypothetical protein